MPTILGQLPDFSTFVLSENVTFLSTRADRANEMCLFETVRLA